MKSIIRFGQYALSLIVFVVVSITAQAALSYSEQGVRILQSTPTVLELEYRPRVQGFDTVVVNGVSTLLPRIAGATVAGALVPGQPSMLVFRVPVSVPSASGFRLEHIAAQRVVSYKALMTPVPSEEHGEDLTTTYSYALNELAYSQPAFASWSSMLYTGQARSQHLATIDIVAARYDGVSASIQIPASVRVKVAFTPIATRAFTETSEQYLTAETVNGAVAALWATPNTEYTAKRSAVTSTGGVWLRIGIESEGLYSIDAQTLKNAGLTVSAGDVPTIKVYGYGGTELPEEVSKGQNNQLIEQPILVRTSPSGELQSIVFYGAATSGFVYDSRVAGSEKFSHYINHYSRRNYYLLSVGGAPGLRAEYASVPQEPVVNTPRQYTAKVFNEEELYNIFNPGSDRRWLGRIANKDIPNTYTTVLPNIVKQGDASVFYRVCVANRVKESSRFLISENSKQILNITCGPLASSYSFATVSTAFASVSASTIKDDRSVLQLLYTTNSGSQSASGNLDWFEIHYPREFVASNNEIEFFSDPVTEGVTEYSINGFSGDIIGFDVTDRARPVLIRNQAQTGGMFVLRAAIRAGSPRRFYIASTLKAPVSVETADVAGLRSSFANTDVIVITNKAFLQSALAYRDYRESQKELSVSVVTVDQIYNEFAAGMPDPTAIRDFLAFALSNWEKKPSYALLWGDGHYDYRNISTQEPVYVPTYQLYSGQDGSMNSVETTSMVEDYFARISGDDAAIDIAIGRIPIRSNDEGMRIVDKIQHYEQESSLDLWRTRITMIADDSWTTEHPVDGEGTFHTVQSETLAALYIPQTIQQKKLYLPEYPTENIPGGRRKPRVTEEMLNAINRGTLILNWIGHGNPRVWAHEQIFEKDVTIPLMTNRDKLFFLSAATCDFGRIDDPARQSGAEELFTSSVGGAIAVFSATRTVYADQNALLNQEFYSHLFDRKDGRFLRLGDALYRTKLKKYLRNDEKFFLLGDPTLRLHIPVQQIRITSINGTELPADSLPTVKALSKVVIAGEVLGSDDATVDASFNGSVVFSLYDSDINKEVPDIGNSLHKYFVFGGLLNISADSVRNGRFSVTVMVPQDISFSDLQGRLNGYAFSQNSTAMGATRDFVIGGVDTTTVNDGKGPQLSVYMDAYTFRAGDLVRPDPVLLVDLYDETGINATGLGIGHDIEAWFDNAANSVRLTGDFTISLDDFRKGTVEKQVFSLAPGTHTVRVRAWDVFNNFSEVETYFRVPGEATELFVEDLFAYPNPFANETTIAFRHNQLENMNAVVLIYTVDGKLVRTLQENVEVRSARILWDGRDEAGSPLPSGVYLYKLQLSSSKGLYNEAEGKAVLIR